jgi:molecular chaperone GrpE
MLMNSVILLDCRMEDLVKETTDINTNSPESQNLKPTLEESSENGSVVEPSKIQEDRVPSESDLVNDSVAEWKKKSDEYLDTLKRIKAEFDNYRKRIDKDRQKQVEFHQAVVLEALFPTLDAFDSAFQKDSGAKGEEFREGMMMLFKGLMDRLGKLGLERLDLEGQPFNPEYAEAMLTVPSSEFQAGHIMQVVTAGYRFKDRIIRPARVIVASVSPRESNTEVQEKKQEE